MTPSTIRVAMDGGWTDGDPGDGRLRFDTPKLASASHLYINARDAQEAMLDEFVPTWRIGDVIVVERPGLELNRMVAWIIGPIGNRGCYWKVPISVRSMHGAFAAHDELRVHHHQNKVDVIEHEPARVVPGASVPPPLPLQSEPAPAPAPVMASDASELERLKTDNAYLLAVLEQMVSDDTPLYTADET